MQLQPAPGRCFLVVNDLLLRACRREPVERPPVWLMRQAGRYLPEYRALRARAGDFLTLVTDPALAAEATLLPVDLIGVDAAIIFSDILVVPRAMGMSLTVADGIGPRFSDPLRSPSDFSRLREVTPEAELGFVLDAIRVARHALQDRVPLIGFAGAPWTLASYMIEGQGTQHSAVAKRLLMENPALAHALLARLAMLVGRFLQAQVRAGAQIVQLFESAGGALAPADFREFALPYLTTAVQLARGGEAGAPVIAFAPGAGWALEAIARESGADVVGVDWQSDAAEARRRLAPYSVAVQGNLDPCWLYAPPKLIRERTRAMLRAFEGPGYIANLGHGILADTPVEHARAFVEAVKGNGG
ncbi:MAG TPA: uroporphyrinogen decarboxylase [Gemmatimonadales bacterium]|nr:uroporphyrinogen decarboxylase [Gemmatimonadales bacterium]